MNSTTKATDQNLESASDNKLMDADAETMNIVCRSTSDI